MDWLIQNQNVTTPEVIQIQLNKNKQPIDKDNSYSPQFARNQSQEMYMTNLTNNTSLNTSMGNLTKEHSRLSPINLQHVVGSSDHLIDIIKE